MKFIAILIVCLSGFYVNAQPSRFTIYEVSASAWDNYTENYDEIHRTPVNMEMTIDQWIVNISDDAHSRYVLNDYALEYDNLDGRMVTYKAIDEKSRSCGIIMYYNRELKVHTFSVVYGDILYTYYYF